MKIVLLFYYRGPSPAASRPAKGNYKKSLSIFQILYNSVKDICSEFFKTSKYSFLELGVDYDYKDPVRTINSIIGKLSENQEIQTIFLLDEIIPNKSSSGSSSEHFSLKNLDISKRNVHLLLAVNPAPVYSGFNKKFDIVPPTNKNTLVAQLSMKHRNSYLVAIFLEHFKLFYGGGFLDSSQDIHLTKDNLPPGRCPVWIQRGISVTDEFILEKIKNDHVLEHESVTLLYEVSINDKVSEFCSKAGVLKLVG